jgi:hypothetical protein
VSRQLLAASTLLAAADRFRSVFCHGAINDISEANPAIALEPRKLKLLNLAIVRRRRSDLYAWNAGSIRDVRASHLCDHALLVRLSPHRFET